jgi:hypothetical protein
MTCFCFPFQVGGRVSYEYEYETGIEERLDRTREGARRVWREKVREVHVILPCPALIASHAVRSGSGESIVER